MDTSPLPRLVWTSGPLTFVGRCLRRGALLALLTSLVACSGGDGASSGGDAPTPTVVNSFSVSVPSSQATPVPISPYMDSGTFNATWSVTSSDPFHIDLYVSLDNVLQTQNDRAVFAQNCGTHTLYACRSQSTVTCQFDTMTRVSCSLPSTQATVTDLTTFLSGLPKSAYLILHACNGLFLSCSDSAISIEFQ